MINWRWSGKTDQCSWCNLLRWTLGVRAAVCRGLLPPPHPRHTRAHTSSYCFLRGNSWFQTPSASKRVPSRFGRVALKNMNVKSQQKGFSVEKTNLTVEMCCYYALGVSLARDLLRFSEMQWGNNCVNLFVLKQLYQMRMFQHLNNVLKYWQYVITGWSLLISNNKFKR